MHVIITCKYGKDRMKNSREKVASSILDDQGQVTLWSVVGSGRISNSTCKYDRKKEKKENFIQYKRSETQHVHNTFKQIQSVTHHVLFTVFVIGPWQCSDTMTVSTTRCLTWSIVHVLVYEKDSIKTAEKKWQHSFSNYKVIRGVDAKGQLSPQSVVGSFRIQTPPSSHACHYQLVYKGSDEKQARKTDIGFPTITIWGLSVAKETKVLIRSSPKPY